MVSLWLHSNKEPEEGFFTKDVVLSPLIPWNAGRLEMYPCGPGAVRDPSSAQAGATVGDPELKMDGFPIGLSLPAWVSLGR